MHLVATQNDVGSIPTLTSTNKDNNMTAFSPSSLVGLSLVDARTVAEANGFALRVVSRDGKRGMVTQDYRTDRINVSVVDDKVTKVSIG